jgi:hypothetical protein
MRVLLPTYDSRGGVDPLMALSPTTESLSAAPARESHGIVEP